MRQFKEEANKIKGNDLDSIMVRQREQEALQKEIDKAQRDFECINDMIADYEDVLKEVGDVLWRLQK